MQIHFRNLNELAPKEKVFSLEINSEFVWHCQLANESCQMKLLRREEKSEKL